MGKEETLLRIKAAEAEARAMRDAAEQDRERTLRDGRREALELRDSLRIAADERYRAILSEAEAGVRPERDRTLTAGRAEADRVKARGRSNVERAIDLVAEKVRGALNA